MQKEGWTLPNNKFLAFTKLKAFADNKFSVVKMIISVYDGIDNIVFPQCFQKVFI